MTTKKSTLGVGGILINPVYECVCYNPLTLILLHGFFHKFFIRAIPLVFIKCTFFMFLKFHTASHIVYGNRKIFLKFSILYFIESTLKLTHQNENNLDKFFNFIKLLFCPFLSVQETYSHLKCLFNVLLNNSNPPNLINLMIYLCKRANNLIIMWDK